MQAADKEDAVLIAVTRNGAIFLSPGNVKLTQDQITEKVRDLLTNKTDRTVYVKADMAAKYGVVEDVVDNVRAAGVDQIGLITETIPDPKKERMLQEQLQKEKAAGGS